MKIILEHSSTDYFIEPVATLAVDELEHSVFLVDSLLFDLNNVADHEGKFTLFW